MLAPALCRDLVTAWSDCEGRASVPTNCRWVQTPRRANISAGQPSWVRCHRRRRRHRELRRAELANATPMREAVVIPHGCGNWPPDEDRAADTLHPDDKGRARSLQSMAGAIRKHLRAKM